MNDDKSKVDRLSESLYSRTQYHGVEDTRSTLSGQNTPEVENNWNSPGIDQMLMKERRRQEQPSTLRNVFWVAVIFFICAMGVAAYIFFEGGNFISSKNVDISVLAPTSIDAGQIVDLGVTVSNKNNADLESAILYVQFPEGTRNPEDSTEPLTRAKKEIGEIKAGHDATNNIQAILFGERGEIKTLKLSVEYKVKGSNATFTKEKDYDIAIGESPVSLDVSMPSSVTSGNTFTTTLTILANSSEILKNVVIRGEYPYGFTVLDSTPEAVKDKNTWILGDLAPGDKKTITITGRLSGQDEEERTFRFYAGVATREDVGTFVTPLSFISETVPIKRPSIGLDIKVNSGNSEAAVAPAGKTISSTVTYRNNLSANLENVKIIAKFSGNALDKSSVLPLGNGFYDSNTNSIVWDQNNSPQLETLAPGDSGVLSFTFASLQPGQAPARNAEIGLTVSVIGKPQGEDLVTVSENKSIKIASEIALSSKSLYSRGPFTNSGPIPPRAEDTTTYTIVFDVRNTQNEINGAKVTAQLGSNVTWLSKTSPSSEEIAYDETKKTVTWNLGTVTSGSGFDAVGREVAFQVSLKPSIGQVGSAPILVNSILFSGKDAFTGETVTTSNQPVTTRISSDPSYIQGNETVTK